MLLLTTRWSSAGRQRRRMDRRPQSTTSASCSSAWLPTPRERSSLLTDTPMTLSLTSTTATSASSKNRTWGEQFTSVEWQHACEHRNKQTNIQTWFRKDLESIDFWCNKNFRTLKRCKKLQMPLTAQLLFVDLANLHLLFVTWFPFYESFCFSLCRVFGSLNLTTVKLTGVGSSFKKHGDAESKGIKAHFNMDESGVLLLDRVRATSVPAAVLVTCGITHLPLPVWEVLLFFFFWHCSNSWSDNTGVEVFESKMTSKQS